MHACSLGNRNAPWGNQNRSFSASLHAHLAGMENKHRILPTESIWRAVHVIITGTLPTTSNKVSISLSLLFLWIRKSWACLRPSGRWYHFTGLSMLFGQWLDYRDTTILRDTVSWEQPSEALPCRPLVISESPLTYLLRHSIQMSTIYSPKVLFLIISIIFSHDSGEPLVVERV